MRCPLCGIAGVAAVAFGLWLAGCTAQTLAPVVDVAAQGRGGPATPDTYVVRPKDTLYSIAYRHELDHRALARANGIEPPYLIKPGQRIRLAEGASPPAASAADKPGHAGAAAAPRATPVYINPPVAATPPVRRPRRPSPSAASTPPPAPQNAAKPAVAARQPAKPAAPPPKPAATPKPAAAVPKPAAPTARAPARPKPPALGKGRWLRPVEVKPVRRFGNGSKGFDYDLPPATPIRAAVAGVVVYAGPGIGGFRHLVIVKTGEDHLVAYGVNVKPLLGEGDRVQAGGAVARIEGDGAADGRFHFEVRDGGKPVDPGPLIGV